jgi:hypothetical protein
MTQPTLRNLIFSLNKKGYKVFDKPYELNIVGIRSADAKQNSFDDLICVFYKDDKGELQYKCYPATTDPGTFYLNNPMSNLGTAALKSGQYIDSHQQGFHKGQYKALTQAKPITVYRDLDRNAIFDFGTNTTTGMYGINIHKAGSDSQVVNNWSAGCQVFKKSSDFDEFMALTDKHKEKNGNKFTYTLLDEREDLKKNRRYLIYIALFGAASFAVWRFARNIK